ncbi:hypothetical protein [Achromobacter kerstersii]|jgi:hypothetical protein|uniref:hypothetical protein n=1 Tax=Achromobacter kerstersii TaxID=1353890 RepID=UPI003209C7EE
MTTFLSLAAGWRVSALRRALAATMVCALVAGCGGDEDSDSDTPSSATQAGDGSAAAQVPIVAPPSAGACPDGGADAAQPPALNSTLDCAP